MSKRRRREKREEERRERREKRGGDGSEVQKVGQSILAVSRAGGRGAGGGQRRRSFHRSVPSARRGFTQAVHLLHEGLQLGVQGLQPTGTARRPEASHLAVRLRFLQVTGLRCLVAADLVVEGRGGGQQLDRRGNQAGLVPNGQQGVVVLVPQGVGLPPDRLFALQRADGGNTGNTFRTSET
ncbi:hypothetical protein EYF80_041192 [Liparis tanakae]|uniref:Uncharacterized protein n=1 Tax=Liparis tanakae TaxID=230148 RepID=A0A4Z2G699_9TELE|nr:hypothetical protein EYF80_041192 [Liparis tanakae]